MSKAGASLATCYGPVSADVIAKAENIRLLILDVDGVLSDGLIYMGNNGEELKAFNVRDGYGIRCALTSDIEVAIITGRKAKLVEDRCATLGITHLYQGQSNKLIAFSDLLEKLAIAPENVAYVGLLPRTKASLSDQGIKVKGLLYECVQMHQKGWFIRNTTKSRPKTIMIGFDPYSVNTIYVFFDENKLEYWEAQLSDFSRQYRNLNWWETGLIQKAIKTVEKQHIQLKSSALNELHEFTDNIVKTAKSRQAQAGVRDLSKAQRTRDIRQNKIEAVQQERAEHIQNRPVNPLKTVHDQDTLQPNQQPSSSNNLDLNRQPDLMRQLFEEEDEE